MKYRWDNKYLHWGVTAFFVIISSILFYWVLVRWDIVSAGAGKLFGILTPFVWGLVIAYLLTPVMSLMERKLFIKAGEKLFPNNETKASSMARSVSIFVSLLLFLVVVSYMLALIATQLYGNTEKLEKLIVNVPQYYIITSKFIETQMANNPELNTILLNLVENFYEYFMNWIQSSFMPTVNQFITSISNGVMVFFTGILNLFVGIVVAIYVMFNKETLGAQIKKLLYSFFKPSQVDLILDSVEYTHVAFGGFLTGKILDSAIIGIICFLGMTVLGLPMPVLISIIIGVTNIIPFFGPFIGAVPSTFLILLEDPSKCVIFLLFVLVLQQVDGNIIGPKILGNSIGLPGLWVLFAILMGGGLFGFVGMICGVPVFSVIYGAVRRLSTNQLKQRNLPVETKAYQVKRMDLPKAVRRTDG